MRARGSNRRIVWLAFALLHLAYAANAAETMRDGPYVVRDRAGQWIALRIEGHPSAPAVRDERVAVGEQLTVAGVGAFPAFEVTLREPSGTASDAVSLPENTPLFVVADTHGEFEITAHLLRSQKIVDDKLRWSFGAGHLVVLGDMFDRGPNHTELVWLLYKLEAEAQRAGGGVHVLVGNHETMALLGDDRYLNPKYAVSAKAVGARHYAALWSERTLLGQWLRSKAALMKIGDFLCAHGGVGPQFVERKLTIPAANNLVREALYARHALPHPQGDDRAFVLGPSGPLWYRGYFLDARAQGGAPRASAQDVTRVLDYFKARRILIGHTKVPTITPLYEGNVIAVQVYPHRDERSGAPVMEALSIERGKLYRAKADGTREGL